MLGDIKKPWLLYAKGFLFLLLGLMASTLLLIDRPTWRDAALLAIVIWSFSRAYYFAFYVIEKYVDPRFKFSGLFSVAQYLISRRNSSDPKHPL